MKGSVMQEKRVPHSQTHLNMKLTCSVSEIESEPTSSTSEMIIFGSLLTTF
jgi:hypothetical protein